MIFRKRVPRAPDLPFRRLRLYIMSSGEMVEWFMAAVLKTAAERSAGGSNPPLSAIFHIMKNGE